MPISWNRAGKRTLPTARATTSSPSSSGWRSASERGTLELRELVEQQHTAMREARLTRPQPRAAADDRRRRRAVVRRAKRRVADQRMVRDRRGPRPNGCASPRAPAPPRAAAGFPAAGARASSCRFPAGPPSSRLCRPAAASSSARRPRSWPRTSARSSGRRRGLPFPTSELGRLELAAQIRDRLGEVTHPDRLDAGQRRLGARVVRTDDPLELRASRSFGHREHAADPPQTPVERELAARRVLGEPVARNLVRRGEDRERDRQVEAGALLLQLRRREVDGDATSGHSSSADRIPLRTRCFAS